MKAATRKFLVCAALALAGVVNAEGQLTRTIDAGGGLYMQQVFGRALVRESSGEASELALPPGASLSNLTRVEGGWMAGGAIETAQATELFLLRSVGGKRRPFPAPPNRSEHSLRSEPVPLVDRGHLVGLAWLAGAGVRETAVYAARWSGSEWSPPELVSPVGPGTQIAIDGTVLADGSWLLVWSAYDGQDDEILWSRRTGGRWSEPRSIHQPNDRPDIVPAVVATGRGALAAWSAFDGSTYRVRLARFEDGAWRELDFVSPPGSVRPSLIQNGDGALLLFRTAVPPSWTLHELDGRGTRLRKAVVENENTFRPGLKPLGEASPVFEWPGEQVSAPLGVEAEWRAEH